LLVFITAQNTTVVRKALRQNISSIGVALSQLLRQWRSWRTGSAAYDFTESFTGRARCPGNQKLGIWPENWPYLDLYDT